MPKVLFLIISVAAFLMASIVLHIFIGQEMVQGGRLHRKIDLQLEASVAMQKAVGRVQQSLQMFQIINVKK